jgi:hypothetical protein
MQPLPTICLPGPHLLLLQALPKSTDVAWQVQASSPATSHGPAPHTLHFAPHLHTASPSLHIAAVAPERAVLHSRLYAILIGEKGGGQAG